MNLSPEEEAIRIDVFWEELQQYSIEELEESFQWARRHLDFFPKPIDIIGYIQREGNIQKREEIEWMEPTKKGREAALKIFKELRERWDKEDKEVKKKRDDLFEDRRKELKKQAKLLGGER
jgi:hypothetical protein